MADRLTPEQLAAKFREASGYDTMPPGWTPVGAWVRVSSGAQDEANQAPAVIRHCIDRKYWPVRWYVVHSKSAYHGEQQGALDEAVEDMRSGQTAILVIWHSDRLERRHERKNGKSRTLLDTLAEFADAGGRVESVQEPTLGNADIGGEITTFVASVMNRDKSRHIAEQVGLALDRIKANNAVPNNVPWGFDTVGEKYNKKMVPTDVCRVYTPQIFDHCIAGKSLRWIAAWLDAEGVKPKRGGKWNESAVRWIIQNRSYAGRRLNRESKTVMTCEAVINSATFDRANKALKTRPKRGPQAANKPMLGNLKCARCGSPMYRIRPPAQAVGARPYFYRCSGSGAQRKGCGNMVGYERLETMVATRMLARNDEPHQIREWVEGKNWDAEISDTLQSIRELDPLDPAYGQQHSDLMTELKGYQKMNEEESTSGRWTYTDVLNDDGSVMTKGQYFYDLYAPYMDGGSVDPAREYLMTQDIRAEKMTCCDGIAVTINSREDVVHNEAEHGPVKCACGCGELIVPGGAHNRKYVNAVHKKRAFRRQQKQRLPA